ncbi:hypothetical protein L2E82_35561 [Cichorium intybus]|uniref:Uncharacterized protein n=1 Tax=Cichorium intybus TaxID=13427 RepID=A0ACB9BPE1_CICIN|nr:hypothetical protein L2E82_35561 [Cichorium intybus]
MRNDLPEGERRLKEEEGLQRGMLPAEECSVEERRRGTHLHTCFTIPLMAFSSTFSSRTIDQGSLDYPYPSHVNAASFVSIKLSGKTNYGPWQKQLMCLLEIHDMLGFIDGTFKNPELNGANKKKEYITAYDARLCREWNRSDTLVKGWIFGSLRKDVMNIVIDLPTARDVWEKLETTYSTHPASLSNSTTSENDHTEYLPLYRAILRGDWNEAQVTLDEAALMFKLNDENETPLHVAIGTCTNIEFVEKLLVKIDPDSLPTLVTKRGLNPLHHAAFVGNTKAAKMLVEKNADLLFLPDDWYYLPIFRAISGSHTDTFQYLLKVTKDKIGLCKQKNNNPFEGTKGSMLLTRVITAGLWDSAYELMKDYPQMATGGKGNSSPLKFVAGTLDGYFCGKPYNFYQRFVYSHVPIEKCDLSKGHKNSDIENQDTHKGECVAKLRQSCFHRAIRRIYINFWKFALQHVSHIEQLKKEKMKHRNALALLKCTCEQVAKLESLSEMRDHYLKAINVAVKYDNCEAVKMIIGYFPQAISTDDNDYPLIQLAIINRCERVYKFLVEEPMTNKHSQKVWLDEYRNNLLHSAAKLAPIHKLNLVSGAALQMQRELQWFEEVKKIACPWHENSKNFKEEKPIMVFRKEHKELRKEGEEWMKKTADSYTITAALIITIVFAAAITVPGGTDGNSGKALYATKPSFIIFAVSDAISLFTSTTSLLLFLSILTARYAEEDFLYKLPKRLIFGLAMLFLSVTSMMVAFSATLYLMFGQGKAWIMIPIATLTCLPIASFVTLQLPLLVDLISSTYGHGIFAKQSDTKIKQS